MHTPQRVIDRLLERIQIDQGTGCWVSLYSTGSHGYSQIGWQQDGRTRMRLGHRVSWEALHGPIPTGTTVDHLCRNRRCINPEHLRLLTNLANAADKGSRRGVAAPEPIGRTCGAGLHELLRYPSGAVACRECAAARARRKSMPTATCPVCGKTMQKGSLRSHRRRVHRKVY